MSSDSERLEHLARALTLHKALRPGSRLELVCASVHRLLGEVSRNAPCPCGSGKKYKRCCA